MVLVPLLIRLCRLEDKAAFSSAMQSVARTGELAREAADELPAILPDDLTAQYPMFANSLLNLLHQAEKTLGSP